MNLEAARSTLMEHSRSSKNGIFPEIVNFEAKLTNPLCGDHVELKIHSDGDTIHDVGFKTRACAICSASASILSQEVKGLKVEHVILMGRTFEKSVVEKEEAPWPLILKGLESFSHLRVNPSRRMCALLPWVVLKNALKKTGEAT